MSTVPAQSQHDVIVPPPPPSSSALPPISAQDAKSLRGAIGLGLVITMPILMILPPRRFNGIMALQMGMFGFGANELLDYRTGQGLLWWASKPYRWANGVDDSEAENQRLQLRLKRRRQRKEEEVKRQIAEEAVIANTVSQVSDISVRSAGRNIPSILEQKARWVGREG